MAMPQKIDDYRTVLEAGEILIHEGDVDRFVYLLEEGKLEVLIAGRWIDTIDATESHEFVGELGAMLGQPRTATVKAGTRCTVLRIPAEHIEHVMEKSVSLSKKMIMSLCKKLSGSSQAHAEAVRRLTHVLGTGSTVASLKNYMSGVLYLMERTHAADPTEEAEEMLTYFRATNPWGLQNGKSEFILKPAEDLEAEAETEPEDGDAATVPPDNKGN